MSAHPSELKEGSEMALDTTVAQSGTLSAHDHGNCELCDALEAQRAALLVACQEALAWYGPDGVHIGEPWRSQLIAAIAKAA
jgi:hypothetical protein